MIDYLTLRNAVMRVAAVMGRHESDALAAGVELGFDEEFLRRFARGIVMDAGIFAAKQDIALCAFVAGVLLQKELT